MKTEKLIPTGDFKVTILAGNNGSGKTKLLEEFRKEFNYHWYFDQHKNGTDRRNDILKYCELYDKIIIDNIELYLDCDKQRTLLSEIFEINPQISIVCSTHSPMIITNGWMNNVIQIEDL